MVRRKVLGICAVFAAALSIAAASLPSFADSNGKQKSPPPRIDVHVGKVTKSPDHPAKGSKKG